MEFRVLGPLEVSHEGVPVDPGSAGQRALLALLLLEAGRPVSRERLIDALWGDDPPRTAAKVVQVHVSQLRKVLPAGRLRTVGDGYALAAAPGELDVACFERLLAEGRELLASGEPDRAARRLGDALALWRGPALADVGAPFAAIEAARLDELRLQALEIRIEADLACGRSTGLIGELERLVGEHPLREPLVAHLMVALARSARQADALEVFRRVRRTFADELGIEPSVLLRDLHQRVLEQDPSIAPATAAGPARNGGPLRRAPAATARGAALAPAPTRYAENGEISLAYQVVGNGELAVLLATGWVLPMESIWEDAAYVRFVERLAASFRVILWDKRGTGLSDRVPVDRLPTLEERMDDVRAVLDASGTERAAIVGLSEGSVLCALFAAAHPERVEALVLYGGWARTIGDDGYPWMPGRAAFDRFERDVRRSWADMGPFLELWAPSMQHDPSMRSWWTRALHQGASPASAVAWLRMLRDFDIDDVLPSIRTPTLVLHRAHDRIIPVGNGRRLAERIPAARYVELPGRDHLWWVGDQDALLREIELFLGTAPAPREADRVLATVLFTDIVDSTRMAADMGDRRWRDLVASHDAIVRATLARFRGTEVKTLGDGFLATFDGPARAIRCAVAIRQALRPLGIAIRAGLHTGEVEVAGDDVHGIAVVIAARVAAAAAPGEVVVSRTVRDLVAGSGLAFDPRGAHELKGLDSPWELHAVTDDERVARPS